MLDDILTSSVSINRILVKVGTPILTKDLGYVPIEQLYLTPALVWNGELWAHTRSHKHDVESRVFNVNFNQRYHIKVSEDFNWLTIDDDDKLVIKKTTELVFGDYIVPFKVPDGKSLSTKSHIRVCAVTDMKIKEKLYYLDYSYSDRFMMDGVLTGIN